jgi:predicted molibdopterin-dependent oxidoreductase YjgC
MSADAQETRSGTSTSTSKPALLRRLAVGQRAELPFTIDGQPCTAHEGDTLFTALLAQGGRLRRNEASGAPRAGFCGMGACQDCWVQLADGRRLRACTTALQAGMAILTGVTR